MDPTRFGALVRTLEERARRQPRLYRAQVALLAALGYGYIIGLLLALLAMIVGLGSLALRPGGAVIAVKLIFPAVVLVWVLVRALWIRIPDLEGLPLTAERVPALFAAIERVRERLDAPRFRRVLLNGEFNAAVAQRPRFGILGPWVNDLLLGLPLLHALSPEEFDAVLAHEMGHVSRQHGRFGHWIYRVRGTWIQLAGAVDPTTGALVRVLLGRFLSWYAPFFNAYTFVLARQDEYEADRASVRVAGRTIAATALLRIPVVGRFYDEHYWGGVSRKLRHGVDVATPLSGFMPALGTELQAADADRWLAEALRRPTDLADTHPSLADRLRGIGAPTPASVPARPERSAAATLLGTECDALAVELDTRWWSQVQPQVKAARAERDATANRLAQLEASPVAGVDAAWERVALLERLDRMPEARAAAEALLAEHPDHAPALFFLGRVRLAADEPDGIVLLERAAKLEPAAAAAVQSHIFEYLWRHGRREEAERARGAFADATDRTDRADQERRSLSPKPVLVPHGLAPEVVERLRRALATVPGLRAAYLVRRVVVEMPEVPCYLVGVVPKARWWKFRRANAGDELLAQVSAAAEWPPSTYFVAGEGSHRRLVRGMHKVPGAVLVGRETRGISPAAVVRLGPA
jgi:Zn-dependent protease with chaperone function